MRVLIALVLGTAVLLGVIQPTAAGADPAVPSGTPSAATSRGSSPVGPIFPLGTRTAHACTASVVSSASRDLIVTAAHCVSGTATGWQFVPGYDQGRSPDGAWTISQAYLDPRWVATNDPDFDYAVLKVAPRSIAGRVTAVQDVAGANMLGIAPGEGAEVTDVAYNAGIDDSAITCTSQTYRTNHYPSFDCQGYVAGSSGSPWISTIPGTHWRAVTGVIGGLKQGGCYNFTSYSSPFTLEVYDLLRRASAGEPPDTAPPAVGNGC
jgi:V8-like Glu-specific endopeptidase